MKKNEFSTDGAIELVEVSLRRRIPKMLCCPESEFDDVKIETKIYTDGKVVSLGETKEENISEYFIDGTKYTHQVDKLKRTKVYLKDYSYAVVYTLGEEFLTVGNVSGFFKVIKDIKVYLRDTKDLSSIRRAKKTIQMVRDNNRSVNYDSLFNMLLSRNTSPKKMEYEKFNKNVFTLKK